MSYIIQQLYVTCTFEIWFLQFFFIFELILNFAHRLCLCELKFLPERYKISLFCVIAPMVLQVYDIKNLILIHIKYFFLYKKKVQKILLVCLVLSWYRILLLPHVQNVSSIEFYVQTCDLKSVEFSRVRSSWIMICAKSATCIHEKNIY